MKFRSAAVLVLTVLLVGSSMGAESFVPDGRIHPDDYTVGMAVDVPLPLGCHQFQAGNHGKFFVEGWTRPDQVFRWKMTVPADDEYAVNVLACRKNATDLEVRVSCAGRSVSGKLAAAVNVWDRFAMAESLRLPAGEQTLTLEACGKDFSASVMSVELVRPAVRDRLAAAARRMRADARWLQEARYGVMCHWTSQSSPRHGPRKAYAEAVRAFDVERFADQLRATGAGFLVLTTSHAEMYFPAPIQALDRVLPGRTTERDLVAELARALSKRGIKLMLYYHLGAINDPTWLRACGFWETDTRKLFDNWTAVISEVGRRYGDSLAGWWFDDGAISYYYRSAAWEKLTRAAKDGNPQRLVGYNPWELPLPTAFQDFHCGEGFHDPGDQRSHRDGLQACATLVTESDWGHFRPDREIGPPRWTTEKLAQDLRQFGVHVVVPIFNLEIYQDGTVSSTTVELFQRVTGY